jgi:3-phosphoshikimate 1-carboxyvinyltransferase
VAAEPITEAVREQAARTPDGLALIDGDRRWTWRRLDAEASAVAGALVELGVRPGDAVGIQLPNCGEFVVTALAVLRAHAVCCPLMPFFRHSELVEMLGRSRAPVLFAPGVFRGRDHWAEIPALYREVPSLRHVITVSGHPRPTGATVPPGPEFTELAGASAPAPSAPVRPDAVAQLLFTSGTSGVPKAVLHRMDTLTRAAELAAGRAGLGAGDRLFVPSPLAHQTGFLYGMWLALLLRAPQILLPVWRPDAALDALNTHGGTFMQAATPFLVDLVRLVEAGAEPPRALRMFVVSGAAVPRRLAERAAQVLGAVVCGAWGSTETGLGTLCGPGDDPARMWGTDGRPLDGVALRIVGEGGRIAPTGAEGLLEVRTPTLFVGYAGDPEATGRAVTPDGWYRSGDLAMLDESGYVTITGRAKDVINRGGEKIPVARIEQLLHDHPAIAEVALAGAPDERLGERAWAFAVLREDAAELALESVCAWLDRHRVSKQYWPERLVVLPEMPRTASGKTKKFVLRELAVDVLKSASAQGG